MLNQYVQAFQGLEVLGIVMLILAVTSFALMVVWALRLPASEVDRCGRLPLDIDPTPREDHP